ncbi:hypothetical protein COI53_25660 [Bacillus thuringiensis]|nr:hypothetical protein COI53_25660 [Bacillus thuringiensis]
MVQPNRSILLKIEGLFLMSRMMAAHSITQVMNAGQKEDTIILGYCKWIRNWFEHDVEKLKQLYSLLPSFKGF